MSWRLTTTLITVSLFLFLAGTAIAKNQTHCPVMGGKINKEVYVDHDGQRVYFCCAGCIDPFKKDPAKYLDKLEKEGVKLKKRGNKGHDHSGHKH